MKNVLYNFYNLTIDNYREVNNNYYFYINNDFFVFYYVENDIKKLTFILDLIKYEKGFYHLVLFNKDGVYFTKVDNKIYSLLKINGINNYEVKPIEFKYIKLNELPPDWGKLWGDRLDYYEIQLREIAFSYQTVINSFGFFDGLAENAILYYNLALKRFDNEKVIGIVHNRMKYPCYLIDYNNPLTFVIDYYVRDICEYIKSYFLCEDFDIDNSIKLIDKLNLNELMFNLMYARLLYFTPYFDMFDLIVLGDKSDSDIVQIINRVDEYINFLKKIYFKYNIKYKMFNIEWLNKT